MDHRGVLNEAFWRLRRRYRWRSFSGVGCSEVLALPPARAALTLSRLAKAGLVVRVGRSCYVAMDPSWASIAAQVSSLNSLRPHPFFGVLVTALSGALDLLGGRLRAAALFGSCARLDYGPESDVDLLLIEDPADRVIPRRLSELDAVVSDCSVLARRQQRERSGLHLPQFVPLTPAELAREPPLLLDMTQDATILYDPESLLARALTSLRTKMGSRGARRITMPDSPPYWILDPTARFGEVGEL